MKELFGTQSSSSSSSSDCGPPPPKKQKGTSHKAPPPKKNKPKQNKKTTGAKKGKKKARKRRVRRIKRKSKRPRMQEDDNILYFDGGCIVVDKVNNPGFYPYGWNGVCAPDAGRWIFGEDWYRVVQEYKWGGKRRRKKREPTPMSYSYRSYTASPSSEGSVDGFTHSHAPWDLGGEAPPPKSKSASGSGSRFETLSTSSVPDSYSGVENTGFSLIPVGPPRDVPLTAKEVEDAYFVRKKRQTEYVRRCREGPPVSDSEPEPASARSGARTQNKKTKKKKNKKAKKTMAGGNASQPRERAQGRQQSQDSTESDHDCHNGNEIRPRRGCLLCYHEATGNPTLLHIVTEIKAQLGLRPTGKLFEDGAKKYNTVVAESQQRQMTLKGLNASSLSARERMRGGPDKSMLLTAGAFWAHYYGMRVDGVLNMPHLIDPVFWALRTLEETAIDYSTQRRKAKVLGNDDLKREKMVRDLRADQTRAMKEFTELRRARAGGNHIVAVVRDNVASSKAPHLNPFATLSSFYKPRIA